MLRKLIKSYIKKMYFSSKGYVISALMPLSWKQEILFFQNIRGSDYYDLEFHQKKLRNMTHQIDKTIYFDKIPERKTFRVAVNVLMDKIKEFPEHDKLLLKWSESILDYHQKAFNAEVCVGKGKPDYDYDKCQYLEQVIKNRRSVRSFTSKIVKKDTLERILDAGLWAPTGCNRQTIEYLILKNKDDIAYCQKQAGEGYLFPQQASHAIVVLVDPRTYALPSQRHMAYLEGGAAIQNMLLLSHSLGIGACWLFWANYKNDFNKRFNLSPWLLPIGMVCLGYIQKYPDFSPVRKPLEKTCHYYHQ